ncbi:MAG: hypothetical protein JO061_06125 [Acidobacteriaceae bacterium]|nr:hypothetical protein [Acidobacteriaceae bacterium]
MDALPKIRAAKTAAEYQDAVRGLTSALPPIPATSGPQRTWVHFKIDRSGFMTVPNATPLLTLELGPGAHAEVPLSEPVRAQLPVVPDPQPDATYANLPYPPTELRILSAYKLWGAVHYFFAYRDLMDDDWDDDVADFLTKFIAAKDAREYHLAVADAVTKLCDSNAQASSSILDNYFGTAAVPLQLMLIDKKPLVTAIFSDEARQKGIQIGDIVTRVDGEEIVARINREAVYLDASTHQSLSDLVMHRILNGAPDSDAQLTVRHGDGATQDVKLQRQSVQREPAAVTKKLGKGIAYVNLQAVIDSNVDSVLETSSDATGIIFDARGPLRADARRIASHFSQEPDTAGAILTGPVVMSPDPPARSFLTGTNSFFSVEAVPKSAGPIFKGKTVMLIDERTIGEAELLGLLLEATNKTAFIGSNSAGAYGEISSLVLPGGITVTFSSTDVRHANTGKLQRVGLEPTIAVHPELADIRADRDVVLEKAVEYLSR